MRGTVEPEVEQLSQVEQRLVDAARSGQLLDLAEGDPAAVEEANGWGPERVVRAGVVRDLLLGRHGELDPRGVRLRGARIDHDLDLDDVRTATPLRLAECRINRVTARRAHLSHLELTDVHTNALQADNLHLEHDLNLTNLHASGSGSAGVVRLLGAHISGTQECDGARLTSSDGPALDADRLQVDGGVFLSGGFQASGAGVTAGAQGIATHTKDTTTPDTHCSLIEQIGLGIGLGAPLLNTSTKTRCALDTDHNTAGSILTATTWLLQLLGFALATLFIAGFTGIIRKD